MRLRTIGLSGTLVLGLLAGPLPSEAQQVGKVYRIGFLDLRLRSTTTDPRHVAFRQGLRELGYVEGQNYVIEYCSAKGKRERSHWSRHDSGARKAPSPCGAFRSI